MTIQMKIRLCVFISPVWILFVSCANTPTTPLPPPDLTVVSTTTPDTDGFVTVVGGTNAAEPDSVVLLFNEKTGSGVMETADNNGAFTASLEAAAGDELVLQYKIETAISYDEAITVKYTAVMDLDSQLFLYLNRSLSGTGMTLFFSCITYLGNGLAAALLILPAMYILDRDRFSKHAAALVISIALSGLVVNVIKPIVDRPRPYEHFAQLGIEVHAPLDPPPDKSFPSGHTQTAFGAATYLSCMYPALSPLFLALAVLTGLSRIAVGVHYPSDVLVGALFGIVFSLMGYRFNVARLRRKSPSLISSGR
jgi:undecaprenyl-diphosphatase